MKMSDMRKKKSKAENAKMREWFRDLSDRLKVHDVNHPGNVNVTNMTRDERSEQFFGNDQDNEG